MNYRVVLCDQLFPVYTETNFATLWNYIKPLGMNLLHGDHCATFKSSATCSNYMARTV